MPFAIGARVIVTDQSSAYRGRLGTVRALTGGLFYVRLDGAVDKPRYWQPLAAAQLQSTSTPTSIVYAADALAPGAIDLSAWSWRLPITLDNSAGIFTPSGFQMPITLTAANAADVFVKARSDGADLLPTDGDGTTPLVFWLESYDSAGMTATLWVKVTGPAAGATGKIYLYYGNAAQATSSGSFDAAMQTVANAGMIAVYHLDEGSGASFADAVGGPAGSMIGGAPTWGAGGGAPFPGTSQSFATGSYVTTSGSNCIELPQLTTPPPSGALMFWFKLGSSDPTGFARLFSLMANPTGGSRGNGWDCYFDNSSVLTVITFTDGANDILQSQRTSWSSSVWYHLCFSWSPAIRTVWINGQLEMASQTYTQGGQGPWAGTSLVNKLSLGAFYQHDVAQEFSSADPQDGLAVSFDEIAILDHQPLPEEVAAHYHRRKYQAGMGQSGRWRKQSAILTDGNPQEPNLISNDSDDQRLYCSLVGNGLNQAVSADGLSFAAFGSNPVTNPGQASFVFKNRGMYYWYFNKTLGGPWGVYYMTSPDGVTWSAPAAVAGLNTAAIGQTWIGTFTSNVFMFYDAPNNRYVMSLEGNSSVDSQWRVGIWTSPDLTNGGTWSQLGSNPKTSLALWPASGYSHLRIFPGLVPGVPYSAWLHNSVIGFGPSFVSYSESNDLDTWTPPEVVLQLTDEVTGGNPGSQLADPCPVERGSGYPARILYDIDVTDLSGNFVASDFRFASFAGTLGQVVIDQPAVKFNPIEANFATSAVDS